MAPSDSPYPSGQSRLYEAADVMLEHSRLPRSRALGNVDGGYGVSENQLPQIQAQPDPNPLVPMTPYTDYRAPYQGAPRDQLHNYDTSIDRILQSPPDEQQHPGQRGYSSFPDRVEPETPASSAAIQRPKEDSHRRAAHHSSNVDGSEPLSPTSSRGRAARGSDNGFARKHRSSTAGTGLDAEGLEDEKQPLWSEMKTKAGKDRKRLPLACIACRRKKIRCSGEKPACKHCLRSRIPCVYKVTARKAAPRTDYMAMLDKRLKRMEERVIKIIPKDEKEDAESVPRAILKPSGPGLNLKSGTGRKRAAVEAFGQGSEESTEMKIKAQPLPRLEKSFSKGLDEGLDKLPSKEIQEHLSEVFFDCVYGQSYHLLHKPSYMRRLR